MAVDRLAFIEPVSPTRAHSLTVREPTSWHRFEKRKLHCEMAIRDREAKPYKPIFLIHRVKGKI